MTILAIVCSLAIFQPLTLCTVDSQPWGFGTGTTGGSGAKLSSIYTVKDYNQFKTALDNKGKPDSPKIIYLGTHFYFFHFIITNLLLNF